MERPIQPNPFPGLRPYGPDEEHLFFGREKEVEAILRRLRMHRFLPVIGTSGCGKSSLVRSGLIPALESGMMTTAGSSWRMAVMRPGEDPIGHLAAALDEPGVLGEAGGELASTNRVLLEATLRRGSLGLVAAVKQAHLSADDNVLILVDQFEELFRFRRSRQIENSRDEAVAFVKLLLEAARQTPVPIYVVLTMRSDFIGDCMDYPGLPEAINESHYLVPRMTRDALRSVITGPIAVAGGKIAPRLVLRLLNDLGDNQDELPLLQHVLMRMWNHWQRHGAPEQPMDIENYTAVGTLREALSQHAEEAYSEVGDETAQRSTERLFKALTDTFTDARGIRRPTSVADLAAICEIPEAQVVRIVEVFRREGRSFLMPPPPVPITARTIVDISHESLMRGWTRLITWAQEERRAAGIYARLSREASYFAEGSAALWDDPELELGLRWRQENRPTAAWARRFDDNFGPALAFLDLSANERTRQRARRRAARLRRLQIAWGAASVLLVLLVIAVWQGFVARREGRRAATNFGLATSAVDELLASVERNQASLGTGSPEMERFRRELLERAQRFYAEFIKQQPSNPRLIEEMGYAHFRLGHIYRMLDDTPRAANEYRASIARFADLVSENPSAPAYKRALASSYNWLAETLRPHAASYGEAESLYGKALGLQRELVREFKEPAYQQELARTLYNRGILYARTESGNEASFRRAEKDFREAIQLLEPISGNAANHQAGHELARAYNNLAALVSQTQAGIPEAKGLYMRAIELHRKLAVMDPGNREHKLEMATISNNYAELLRGLSDTQSARDHNDHALALIDDLVRPAASLGIELADAHNVRGRILQSAGAAGWPAAYRRSLEIYQQIERGGEATTLPAFHQRFGDLLLSLAAAQQAAPKAEVRRVLTDAVAFYGDVGVRAVSARRADDARQVAGNLNRTMEMLAEGDRAGVAAARERVQTALAGLDAPR
jgi:tetratricopeptide (TPR) repeat protein